MVIRRKSLYDFDTSKGLKTFIVLRFGRKVFTSFVLGPPQQTDTPQGYDAIHSNLMVTAMFTFRNDMYKVGIISASNSAKETANKLSPFVALFTGRLRNAFHAMMASAQIALTTGNQHFNSIVDMLFQLQVSDFTALLDYAQYHITELTGETSYMDPHTPGTRPTILSEVSNLLMFLFGTFMFSGLWSLGWDINANLDVDVGGSIKGGPLPKANQFKSTITRGYGS